LANIIQTITIENLKVISDDLFEIAQRRYKWGIIANKYMNCLK